MSIPLYLSQHFSPFKCCKKSIDTQKELNLYQAHLHQPLKLLQKQKSKAFLKMNDINEFYQDLENKEFKVVFSSDYNIIKKRCEQEHQLFTDQEFKPNSAILQGIECDKTVIWRRISQLYDCGKYKIFDGEKSKKGSHISLNEVDCSNFGSILNILNQNVGILKQIFRSNYEQLNTFGIYRAILNDNGYPTEVIIDDFVPVLLISNQNVLTKTSDFQLWPLIIEKSLLKLCGSYAKLLNLSCDELLRFLTPAPTVKLQLESREVRQNLRDVLQFIRESIQNGLIVCCTSKAIQQHPRINPSQIYKLIAVESFQASQYSIILQNPLFKFQEELFEANHQFQITQFQMNNNLKSLSKNIKIAFHSFFKFFQDLSVSYFKQNYNMDFERLQMCNRQPKYLKLQIRQQCEAILTLCRVKRRFINFGLINLSRVQTSIRNIIGIKGGWIKILVSKQTKIGSQSQLQFIHTQMQTEQNVMSLRLGQLKTGKYVIYVEGFSEQDEKENYVFSVYCDKIFKLEEEKRESEKKQYFLQEAMLSHCLSTKQSEVNKNYFIENDIESWYLSNFMYLNGGFGYIVIYLSKNTDKLVQVVVDNQIIRTEGFKLECKKPVRKYVKRVNPGEADVIVFSLDLCPQKYINSLEFPPKGVQIEVIESKII